jgi:pimeloyl-ACP methyl ester carboxylesterase
MLLHRTAARAPHADVPGVSWPKDRRVRSRDGADVAYTFLGPEDGRVVALCAGLLCPDTWWHHLVPALLAEGHRVLVFHYRGVGTSGLPEQVDGTTMAPDRFAADLVAIVEAEGLDDLTLVGHSTGVQVALEAWAQLGGRTRALVALTGPFASPLRSLYDRPEISWAVYEPLRVALSALLPPVRRVLWRTTWDRLPVWRFAQLIRAFGPRTDPALVRSYLDHAAAMDPTVVLRIVEGVHAHDAAPLLPEVDVPTLVVVGGKDPFSPPSQGRAMAAAIPGAVLREVPGGTHGAILEYPEVVNGYVLDFLRRTA